MLLFERWKVKRQWKQKRHGQKARAPGSNQDLHVVFHRGPTDAATPSFPTRQWQDQGPTNSSTPRGHPSYEKDIGILVYYRLQRRVTPFEHLAEQRHATGPDKRSRTGRPPAPLEVQLLAWTLPARMQQDRGMNRDDRKGTPASQLPRYHQRVAFGGWGGSTARLSCLQQELLAGHDSERAATSPYWRNTSKEHRRSDRPSS